jgi:hypothetical protein
MWPERGHPDPREGEGGQLDLSQQNCEQER